MRVTRRGRGAALAGLLLVGLGLLLDRPLLLVGGALLGAWLLTTAWRFVTYLDRTLDALTLDHHADRDRVVTGRRLGVTLAASLETPSRLDLTIDSNPPPSTTVSHDDPTTVSVPVNGERATTTYLASWPHAGAVTFDPPTVTATDRLDLFETTFASGPTPAITVAPRTPRDIHVGRGGERLAAAYGDHRAGRRGSGLEPAELREYVPGDAATRIDWKATARLAAPYVREFEVETDRRTVLVLVHRASTNRGPAGETALDYLREVALAFVETARAFDDPLGCYTVGDDGVTGRWLPEVDRRQYAQITRHVGNLSPTSAEPAESPSTGGTPADARRTANRLGADGSAFATTLAPYFDRPEAYVQRVAGNPLSAAVRNVSETLRGPRWTVILADDTDRAALRQSVSVAHRGDARVLVYLTPSVLFEPGGLADLEAAYDRYVDFEEFRRALSRPPTVDAFEVAPGDRVQAVLGAGRQRRQRSAPAGGA